MHVRSARSPGRETLISSWEGEANELNLIRLVLAPGSSESLAFDGEEAAIVLLDGAVTFEAAGQRYGAERENPFVKRASALYLPPGTKATVQADQQSELLVATTACEESGQVAFIGPEQVVVNARGKGVYVREVHDILVSDPYAKRLLVGETFNPPGNWSSFPPHKHDGEDDEPYLEEVYYYRLSPSQGFGYQGLYATDGSLDEGYTVRDGDAVLISRGYHPVAAAPGYSLYYLWVLAGEQRQLVVFEDPAHRWLHQQ